MPTFRKILRELEDHLAGDDPIKRAHLDGVRAGRRQAYIEVLVFTMLILFFAGILFSAQAQDCDAFIGCDAIVIDEDGPDQDPIYDEDDPIYDEMDDYDVF